MGFDELKRKARLLPLLPGVYIMKDKSDQVIYVGKAKKLRNRVVQYFQDTVAHTAKTKHMVSKVCNFDVIVVASEFEALVLECSLIKRHQPKYNILLKDDKGYPFVRLDMKAEYPTMSIANKISDDGADYYGPYGSRGVTNSLLETITLTLRLPNCSKKFPRDLGKDRLCLNYHMGNCAGWCQEKLGAEEYRRAMEQARQLLQGKYKTVADEIKKEMLDAANELNFELAASLRDRLNAVTALGQKQLVTAGALADTDVIGYAQTETKACFAVLHFNGGNLLDKEYELIELPDDPSATVSSLIKQYYLSRGFAPRNVLLPFPIDDSAPFSQLLTQEYGRKTFFKVPQRGDNLRLIDLAQKNATEEAERVTDREERTMRTVTLLGKMLSLDPPARIESFDISNISGTDIVASMIVFCDGKPKKSEYKRFKIENLEGQDDYASMRQVIDRRFTRYVNGDAGFESTPDILLIDGGVIHAQTAVGALKKFGLSFPVFGIVKDDRHRTRALVTPDGSEIRIDAQQSVFSFIGRIQEETHRFAVTYHRNLRSKRLKYSELDGIPGIGPKRKQTLLKAFKSLTGISEAQLQELERFLPRDAAIAVYQHFKQKRNEE